jgi:DNA-binding transcriptional ArsR family regulator
MKEFITITKALADESRVRLLLSLEKGELCVCQLIELIGLAPSTVSRHMSVLKQAGLVEMRKEGRWAYYRVAGEKAPKVVKTALELTFETAGSSPTALQDKAKLREILACDPEDICRRITGKCNG